MTKERLEQLINLRAEIKELNREISDIRSRSSDMVTDKVTASSQEFPYNQVIPTSYRAWNIRLISES